MLEKIKMYFMLKKSCNEFDKQALENLLYHFENNLNNINNSYCLHSINLSNLQKDKKNSKIFFAEDIDDAIFNYNKLVNKIIINKNLVRAEKTAIKSNKAAIKVIKRRLKQKGN